MRKKRPAPQTEESQAVCRQPLTFTMPRSKAKNNTHKLQNEKHLLPMASEEMPDTDGTVVDQDMLDWFAKLFDTEMSESGIQDLTPSMKPFADAPQGIEPRHYYLRDVDQKSIYLQDKNLVAAPLQGDNSAQEEILSVLPNRFLNRQKIPLILGVKGGSQGISCGKEEKPKLQLEDANLMDLFTNDEEAKRFTFFKLYNGSTNKFESATFPGWYLCSPVEAHKPLGVTSQPGENALIDFYFHQN
ncbi:interleukin-1 family member 10-like isoform X2 [Paroedura picta]|uniref:interleukin-1 family member 10-like isoform X2 n=1 Tax=Paroedura picta TaxID=143630 RepID=UPI001014592F